MPGPDYYILDQNRTVQPCDDFHAWARWMYGDNANALIDRTTVEGDVVSTVFLGFDHRHGGGPPELFESAMFPGYGPPASRRYATYADAVAGHQQWVADLRQWAEQQRGAGRPVWAKRYPSRDEAVDAVAAALTSARLNHPVQHSFGWAGRVVQSWRFFPDHANQHLGTVWLTMQHSGDDDGALVSIGGADSEAVEELISNVSDRVSKWRGVFAAEIDVEKALIRLAMHVGIWVHVDVDNRRAIDIGGTNPEAVSAAILAVESEAKEKTRHG